MSRSLFCVGAVALFLLLLLSLSVGAQPPVAPSEEASARDALDPRVAELLEMSPERRRAELRAMDPAERRGLWMQVRRARGEVARRSYKDNAGHAVHSQSTLDPRRGHGTIQYDSGFPTIGFGGGAIIGNRFNTHEGNGIIDPGTVSTIQALVAPGPANTTSSAGFVLLGPQTSGGGAMALFSTFTGATGVIDSLAFTGLGVTYTGSSFFVLFGDFASVYIPVYGTGTTKSQGHHGVVGYTGGMGPNITSTFDFGGALNSYIRATGEIVAPVELTTFEVD